MEKSRHVKLVGIFLLITSIFLLVSIYSISSAQLSNNAGRHYGEVYSEWKHETAPAIRAQLEEELNGLGSRDPGNKFPYELTSSTNQELDKMIRDDAPMTREERKQINDLLDERQNADNLPNPVVPENSASFEGDAKKFKYSCDPNNKSDIKAGPTYLGKGTSQQSIYEGMPINIVDKKPIKDGDTYVAQEKDFREPENNEKAYSNRLRKPVKKVGEKTIPKPECVVEQKLQSSDRISKGGVKYVPSN